MTFIKCHSFLELKSSPLKVGYTINMCNNVGSSNTRVMITLFCENDLLIIQ